MFSCMFIHCILLYDHVTYGVNSPGVLVRRDDLDFLDMLSAPLSSCHVSLFFFVRFFCCVVTLTSSFVTGIGLRDQC